MKNMLLKKVKFGFTLAEGATHVNLLPTKVKFGFTLAEVLITLGIIGVVAAMTIPTLISSHQKQAAVAGIKEAQSILNQAIKLYTADTDEDGTLSFDTKLPIEEFAQKYFVPYLKIARICTQMSDGCWQTGDFNGYYDLAGVKMTNTVPYSIVLNNGMVLGFNQVAGVDGDGRSFNIISIIVDINGKSGRNTMGKDVFSFYLFNNENSSIKTKQVKNGIYVGGYAAGGVPHTQFSREQLLSKTIPRGCNKEATQLAYDGNRPGVGTACAAVIFKDGWKIANDYPWN